MSAPVFQLTADGDLVFPTRRIDGPQAIAQRALVRLRTHAGEYILDRRVGVNWIGFRDGKITDERLQVIRAAIVAEINDMDGVRVTASSASFANRTVSITLSATIEDEDDAEEVVSLEFGVGGGLSDPLTLLRLIQGGSGAA